MLKVFSEIEDTGTDKQDIPREYEIDFQTGRLTGKIVEGKEALRVWCFLALHTERYKYRIHTWDYGHELSELIGAGYEIDYTKSEIERMISDCLTAHPDIQSISDFDSSLSGSHLSISLKVESDFGQFDFETEVTDIV